MMKICTLSKAPPTLLPQSEVYHQGLCLVGTIWKVNFQEYRYPWNCGTPLVFQTAI